MSFWYLPDGQMVLVVRYYLTVEIDRVQPGDCAQFSEVWFDTPGETRNLVLIVDAETGARFNTLCSCDGPYVGYDCGCSEHLHRLTVEQIETFPDLDPWVRTLALECLLDTTNGDVAL